MGSNQIVERPRFTIRNALAGQLADAILDIRRFDMELVQERTGGLRIGSLLQPGVQATLGYPAPAHCVAPSETRTFHTRSEAGGAALRVRTRRSPLFLGSLGVSECAGSEGRQGSTRWSPEPLIATFDKIVRFLRAFF